MNNRFLDLNEDLHYFRERQKSRMSESSSYYYQHSGDPIEMPPLEIKVSPKRKAQILKKAGWKKATVMMVIKDFRNQPLLGYKVFIESQAPKVAPQYEGKDVKGGAVIFSDFWIKPTGILRIMALSTTGAALAPSGTIHYTLPKNNVLKLDAAQGSKEMEVVATNSSEAAAKAGAKGTAGVDFKVFKVGGEVTGERSSKRGESMAYKYKVILPAGDLRIKVVK